MFRKKVFLSKDFNKSYLAKNAKTFNNLTINYQELFLKVKKNGLDILSEKEKILFFQGISDISEYISKSFEYTVFQNYDLKPNTEKILSAIFFRLSSFLGNKNEAINTFKEDIKDISENSIYLSLGLEKYKKRNYLWNEDCEKYNNFIKHTITKVFNNLLLDFFKEKESKLNKLSTQEDLYTNENLLDSSAQDLIEKIEIKIPKNIEIKILNYLNGDINLKDLTEHEKKFLNLIYNKIK